MNLEDIQKELKKQKLDALYISRNSAFIGQDILVEENFIQKLTNFSGSAGELIVTPNISYLFVDSRYTLQAKLEVDSKKICLFEKISDLFSDLYKEKKRALRIGINPWTTSMSFVSRHEKDFINFVPTNIIQIVKTEKKPKVFELEMKFAGVSRSDKVSMVGEFLIKENADMILVSAADSSSWLLNLRSDYLPNSPIFRGFVVVDKNKNVTIFSDDLEGTNISFEKNVKILPFMAIEKELEKNKKKYILLDKDNTSEAISILTKKYTIKHSYQLDICQLLKSQKNLVEIEGIKKAHIRDGVAISKFLFWLENTYRENTEISAAEKLYSYRKKQENFFSNSFDTIAGFAENGAIVHYHATEKSNKKLDKESLLLLDSGAQYFDGTTDMTRTIALGKPTKEMISDYTMVLKSHIALASTIFPVGTTGGELNAIAKYPLWQEGKDFGHGTGHGVGHFLNVHEGPQRISKNGSYELKKNMVLSIEPGFYKEGDYGIRIENLYCIVNSEKEGFLAFSSLTLVPIEQNLIDFSKLTNHEKKWLENYHKKVYDVILPFMNEDEKLWLKNKLIK